MLRLVDVGRYSKWRFYLREKGAAMRIETDKEVSLFVRDPVTGRLVFNAKAIKDLGLDPVEIAQRGYPLDDEIASPATVPEDQPANNSAND